MSNSTLMSLIKKPSQIVKRPPPPSVVPILFITTYNEIMDVQLPVKGRYVIDKEAQKAWGNSNLRLMERENGDQVYGMILDERYSAPVYVGDEKPWNPGTRREIVSHFYSESRRTVSEKPNKNERYIRIFTVAIYALVLMIILTLALGTIFGGGDDTPEIIMNTAPEVVTP